MLDTNISFFSYLLLIFILGIIIFILYVEPKINQRKVKNKNEHGSSSFATKNEISKVFAKENILDIKSAGFPVYFEKKKETFTNVFFDNVSPHWVLIGSTGSGKSSCVVLPECVMFAHAKTKSSLIITDPKGEIFSKTSKLFHENGYNIITIDFRNPQLSNHINIMQPIITEWKLHCSCDSNFFVNIIFLYNKLKINCNNFLKDENYRMQLKKKFLLDDFLIKYITINMSSILESLKDKSFQKENNSLLNSLKSLSIQELILKIKSFQNDSATHQAETIRLTNSLSDLIFSEKESKDPFWLNSAKNLFKGICGIFLEEYKDGIISENQINISSIKKFQNSSLIKENQIFLQSNLNNREYGTLSKDYLTSILSASENTYKSIISVFAEKMQIFDDLNVENVTNSSDFAFSSIVDTPTVLYIIAHDEDRSYYQLITIIVGILYKDLTKLANMPRNNGVLPRKLEWILDEFANCPPLADIETIVSVARSRGMRFQFFIQSFSQLENVYSKDIANIILDNSALCYLKTNSIECAETIARKLGKSTIEVESISQSTDHYKIGANKTTSLLGRELLTANEIISLKYKMIIFPTFSNPIFRDTYLYNDIFKNESFGFILRKVNVLKKDIGNYYTVEKMREIHEELLTSSNIASCPDENPLINIDKNSKIDLIIKSIEKMFNMHAEDNQIIINRKISVYEENRILDEIKPMINIDIAYETSKTIINFFDAEKYRYRL